MSVKQIVYSSWADEQLDETDLTELLDRAREKNKANTITGALLCAPGRFIQCIEGEEERIDALYARIGRDSRHRDVCLLQELTLPTRYFSDWTMGAVNISQSEYMKISTADWERVANADSDGWISPGFVLLKSIWDQCKAASLKAMA